MAGTGGWLQYHKLIPLRARQATVAGLIETLTGPMPYAVGDYICEGLAGEIWPRAHARFEVDYLPEGIPDVEGWGLWHRREPIWARQRPRPFTIYLADRDPSHGRTRDWEARNGPGRHWVISESTFAASYAPWPPAVPDQSLVRAR